jgi:hypothetical protein
MYRIIGADGKEYGPVTLEVMRQWLAQGRVNAQTKVLLEGTTDWKSLSEFPELGTVPGAIAPAPLAYGADTNLAAQDQVNGPAVGLMIVAILGLLMQVGSLVYRLFFSAVAASQPYGPFAANGPMRFMFSASFAVLSAIVGVGVGVLILIGALKMKKLENYGLAMVASIVAMIPCLSPCCLIGLPIGIWAVVILSKPEVKAAFR